MVEILPSTQGDLLATRVSEKLTSADYDILLPHLDKILAEHGEIRWYFEMVTFHGWDLAGFWRDVKFDVQHANDFSRIAMVGEKQWQQWMTDLMKPFTSAEIRFFELKDRNAALDWVQSDN